MKRLFLAEDDSDDQEIFKAIMEERGDDIDLTVVDNGERLIQRIESVKDDQLPDLILLDQNMPRMNGYETIQVLKSKERYKDIPMVIYSTYRDSKFLDKCKSENIPFHQKPDTYNGLRKLVDDIVRLF
jgi:CheY-like chemotaxis protein